MPYTCSVQFTSAVQVWPNVVKYAWNEVETISRRVDIFRLLCAPKMGHRKFTRDKNEFEIDLGYTAER